MNISLAHCPEVPEGGRRGVKQWFAIQTRPRQEALAEVNLHRQGYEVYCPRIRHKRRSRGRWRQIIEPLFPRYLFVCLSPGRDNFAPIRYSIGVRDFIRFGGIPGRVSEGLIQEIRRQDDLELGAHLARQPWQAGMEVEVVVGPFAGCRGIFAAACGIERAMILLQWLGRENNIEVAQDAIVPV